MNPTVEKLIRKMIYAKAGGHEDEYIKARQQAEAEIQTMKTNNIIKLNPQPIIRSPKSIIDVFELVAGLIVFVPVAIIIVLAVLVIRCLILH